MEAQAVGLDSDASRELTSAHLAEERDHLEGTGAGELHGGFPQSCQAASRPLCTLAQRRVSGDEAEGGFAELVLQSSEPVGEFGQARVWDMAADAIEERVAGALDGARIAEGAYLGDTPGKVAGSPAGISVGMDSPNPAILCQRVCWLLRHSLDRGSGFAISRQGQTDTGGLLRSGERKVGGLFICCTQI